MAAFDSAAFDISAFSDSAFDFDAPAGDPPVLIGQVPNYSVSADSGSHQADISDYFTGATSYSISPAVEVGWNFNTSTGVLTFDTDDTGTFGPYTVTATNADGGTPSNAFTVRVVTVTVRARRWRFGFGFGY